MQKIQFTAEIEGVAKVLIVGERRPNERRGLRLNGPLPAFHEQAGTRVGRSEDKPMDGILICENLMGGCRAS